MFFDDCHEGTPRGGCGDFRRDLQLTTTGKRSRSGVTSKTALPALGSVFVQGQGGGLETWTEKAQTKTFVNPGPAPPRLSPASPPPPACSDGKPAPRNRTGSKS